MFRFVPFLARGALCALAVSFISGCAGTPPVKAPRFLVLYGAGSAENDPEPLPRTEPSGRSDPVIRGDASVRQDPAKTANKAELQSPLQKIRNDETMAQAVLLEKGLDDSLASLDFAGALSSFDSLSALLSSVPGSAPRLQEDRQKIAAAFDPVSLSAVSSPSETVAGTAFKKDFSVRVTSGSGDQARPVAGLECLVAWPGQAADGTKATCTAKLVTAADGSLAFTAPVPQVSGRGAVVVTPVLECRDPALRELLSGRQESGSLRAAMPHVVATNARNLSTTISILDFDRNGKAIMANNLSSTALLMPLVQKGFRRMGMADFQNELKAGDEAALLKAAKTMFNGGVQRFIYGTSRIESLAQGPDGLWTCTIESRVTVRDLFRDVTVCTSEIRHAETAKTDSAAIEAARRKVAGELLVVDLVYNM